MKVEFRDAGLRILGLKRRASGCRVEGVGSLPRSEASKSGMANKQTTTQGDPLGSCLGLNFVPWVPSMGSR